MGITRLFQIDGGIGKCIAATAVCAAVKKQYPDDTLIVVSGYPEVFLGNPHINYSFQMGNLAYFYSTYVEGKEIKAMLHNPYLEENYFQEKKHLIEVWCDMFDIKYSGEKPEMFLTQRELDFFQKKYTSDKPIMVMQTNGGASVDIKYSWARDLPSAAVTKVIDVFAETHNIVHIRRDDQIGYAKTTPIHAGLREILALTLLSDKRFLIDSFLQHGCAALNLPATVCWIANSPKVLGYELHDNILANPFTKTPELRQAYINKFNIGGELVEYPFNNDDEIFDVDKIIASLGGAPVKAEAAAPPPSPEPPTEAKPTVAPAKADPVNIPEPAAAPAE
jgi:hypothetical protein